MDMVKRTITTDVELYNDILLYKVKWLVLLYDDRSRTSLTQPLQLASIQGKLKSAGTPVAKDKLMDILDQLVHSCLYNNNIVCVCYVLNVCIPL